MEINEQRSGAVTVVRPVGPMLQADSDAVREALRRVLSRSLGRFVLDASRIAYVDSAGLEALLDVTEEMSQSGQSLKLCGATETLREILELTEMTDQFEYFEDVPTAVRSFL